jgi:CspA family cold shock protein
VATNGIVKFFNLSRAFRFIATDRGRSDPHVDARAIERAAGMTLREGQRVSYDLQRGADGKLSAINVRAL